MCYPRMLVHVLKTFTQKNMTYHFSKCVMVYVFVKNVSLLLLHDCIHVRFIFRINSSRQLAVYVPFSKSKLLLRKGMCSFC